MGARDHSIDWAGAAKTWYEAQKARQMARSAKPTGSVGPSAHAKQMAEARAEREARQAQARASWNKPGSGAPYETAPVSPNSPWHKDNPGYAAFMEQHGDRMRRMAADARRRGEPVDPNLGV